MLKNEKRTRILKTTKIETFSPLELLAQTAANSERSDANEYRNVINHGSKNYMQDNRSIFEIKHSHISSSQMEEQLDQVIAGIKSFPPNKKQKKPSVAPRYKLIGRKDPEKRIKKICIDAMRSTVSTKMFGA